MFDHWATGLRSGLLPHHCEVATQKLSKKGAILSEVLARVLIFWCQGMIFWRVLVGSRKSPASFLQGLAPPVVRWEVSYKRKSFRKKLEV